MQSHLFKFHWPAIGRMILILMLLNIHAKASSLKEIEFNWSSAALLWDGQANYVPCMEPFNIKVTNCPANTTAVTIHVYESTGTSIGDRINPVTEASVRSSHIAIKTGNDFVATITPALRFKRFYYLKFELVTESTVTTSAGAAAPTINQGPITQKNPTTTEQIITTNVPAAVAMVNGAATTITKTITTETKSLGVPVYAIPFKNELSKLEFLGALGAAQFSQKGLADIGSNIGFVTGLKFKFKPVSTNPTIGRFGLYPQASRWSFVVGTVINDLKYKSSDLKASVVGLKPIIGLDYEFTESVGLTVASIIAKQDDNIKLTSNSNFVTGIYIGLSFSLNAFQKFRANVPANQNFPSTGANNGG